MFRTSRSWLLAALLAAAACGKEEAPTVQADEGAGGSGGGGGTGGTDELQPPSWDESTFSQRWKRKGLGAPQQIDAVDLDEDGSDEFLLGGRGVSLIDDATLDGAHPRWSLEWKQGTRILDGGEADLAYAIARFDGNEDGAEDVLVINTARHAYLIDLATGDELWHRDLETEFLPARVAVFDADRDGVKDFLPVGNQTVFSGKTGEPIWTADIPNIVVDVAVGEFDGQPGEDVLIGVEEDRILGAPFPEEPTFKAVFGYSGAGAPLFDFAPYGQVTTVAVSDLDGDGIDEAIAATNQGWIYAMGADGNLRWKQNFGDGAFLALAAGDADGDGKGEVFAGFLPYQDAVPSTVVAYGSGGSQLWTWHVASNTINELRLEQLDGDPSRELLVATAGQSRGTFEGQAYAFETNVGAASREQWMVDVGHYVYSFELARHHGRKLVLFGAEDGNVRAVDAGSGAAVWTYRAQHMVTATAAGDLDGDGIDELVHGDSGGNFFVSTGADGERLWTRRIQTRAAGSVMAVAVGDVDGDGANDVAVGGFRTGDTQGFGTVEVRSGRDGSLIWSVITDLAVTALELTNIDDDPALEVIVAQFGAPCQVAAFDDGLQVWTVPLDTGAPPTLHLGDVDGDGTDEIAYSSAFFLDVPDIALIDGDGTLLWHEFVPDTMFVRAVEGGVINGGGASEFRGMAEKRGLDAEVLWTTYLEPIPDPEFPEADPVGNYTMSAALTPDRGDDGFSEIAVYSGLGEVMLLDGATGEAAWSLRLQPVDTGWQERHDGAVLAYVPASEGNPELLVAAETVFMGFKRGNGYAIDLDGGLRGTFPLEGPGFSIATGRFDEAGNGAVVGAGVSLYAVEARKAE